MSKKWKKRLCVMLAAVMCLAFAGIAMAAIGTVNAIDTSSYGTLSGEISSNSSNSNSKTVTGKTTVEKNGGGATLFYSVAIYGGGTKISDTASSPVTSTGTCMPSSTTPVVDLADAQANRAESTHRVIGAAGSYYTTGSVEIK